MTTEEAKKIFAQVRANSVALSSCTRHDFQPDPNDKRPILKRQVCSRCGGWVDFGSASWYRKGLSHAGS